MKIMKHANEIAIYQLEELKEIMENNEKKRSNKQKEKQDMKTENCYLIPKYFNKIGWFSNENTFKFICWSFTKCKPERSIVFIDGQQVVLAPFEFMCGREKSSKECFLTPTEFRTQIKNLLRAGILKKTENSKRNSLSAYVWMIDVINEKLLTENYYEGCNR